ncbi:MAG: hypothetical protein GXY77_10380 [Fibrobacter sp.]|nr:hypothetical protein [Fibrobacter sp.]
MAILLYGAGFERLNCTNAHCQKTGLWLQLVVSTRVFIKRKVSGCDYCPCRDTIIEAGRDMAASQRNLRKESFLFS